MFVSKSSALRCAAIAVASIFPTLVSADDVITRLSDRLERGETKLDFRQGGLGYLPSLLQHLDLNIDSQLLVFAKNSLQAPKISPQRPRALYFNDNVSVGFVRGGELLEIAALDPVKGVVMYTLATAESAKPKFEPRDRECASCHGYSGTVTLTVTSVFPKPDGEPFLLIGGPIPLTIDHRTPLEQRWGGWYVSGTHGAQHHMGNAIAPDPFRPMDLETRNTENLTSLSTKLDVSPYLAPSSDIVALMTLEHQTRMTNLLTRAGRMYRAGRRDDTLIDELVTYMLFADEVPLTDPIRGVSTFTETFAQRGPRDSKGRSLRDFDLKTRMFRYPLSYMVYSETLDALPAALRDNISQRISAVLTGENNDPKFSRLAPADRRAILEILRDTKPSFKSPPEPRP